MAEQHEDRARARNFGAIAALYDRARPTYPPALVADLLATGPVDIVDVGCGTGKAARLFVGSGRRVLGVEPDPRMAAVARDHGIEVEVAEFERWACGDRRFDLLVSGTAWHWVNPAAGAAKAALVLRPGGRFAAFWNEVHHGDAVQAVFDEVYGRWAPGLLATSFVLGVDDTIDAEHDPAGAALAAGPFDVAVGQRRHYAWTVGYGARDWVDFVSTQSDHRQLDAETRQGLLDELEVALTALGPHFAVGFRTDLLSAVRR